MSFDEGIRTHSMLDVLQYRRINDGGMIPFKMCMVPNLILTDGNTYVDKVEIGKVNISSYEIEYKSGESFNTVWRNYGNKLLIIFTILSPIN